MRVSNDKMLVVTLIVATVTLCCLALLITQQESRVARNHIASQSEVESILTKLQSRDESEVLEAKAKLAEMGEDAIEPLISLLRDLTNQSVKRPGTDSDRTMHERTERVVDPNTKSRTENDIYEVLGRLHAVEAVPLLVAIMEKEEIDDMIQGMSPVMRALAEIGPGAVPQLTMSIDGAKSTASAFLASNLTEESRQRNLGWFQGRIELRATLVLREIGDPRAIPALERLETTSDNQFIVTQAREAVRKIQNKSGQ